MTPSNTNIALEQCNTLAAYNQQEHCILPKATFLIQQVTRIKIPFLWVQSEQHPPNKFWKTKL